MDIGKILFKKKIDIAIIHSYPPTVSESNYNFVDFIDRSAHFPSVGREGNIIQVELTTPNWVICL